MEEIKKALEELRASLTKYDQLAARIDQIAKDVETGKTTVVAARTEIDAIKASTVEREKAILELQRTGRVQREELMPAARKEEALIMLGMVGRRILARKIGTEIPAQYKDEAARVDAFEADIAARATLAFNSTPGSYLVPTVLETAIIDAMPAVSPLVGNMDYVPNLPLAGTINLPVLTGRPILQPARASSDTKMTQSDPAFDRVTLTPREASIFFPIDNNFLIMSPLALGQILINLINQALIQGMAAWSIYADGTTNFNFIKGMMAETNPDYLYTLPAGKTAYTDLTKSDLTAMKQKLFWQFWQSGKWLMNLDTLGVVEDMNRLGLVPVMNQNQDRILQNEFMLDGLMPNRSGVIDMGSTSAATNPVTVAPTIGYPMGPGKGFMGFGDPKTFLLGVAGGVRIASSSDYLFGNNQTAFRAVMLMDMARKPVKSFVVAQTAAANLSLEKPENYAKYRLAAEDRYEAKLQGMARDSKGLGAMHPEEFAALLAEAVAQAVKAALASK